MILNTYAAHPLPDLSSGELLAAMPIAEAVDGPLYDRQTPCDANDRLFADWDVPLVWHHQKSQVKLSTKFYNQRAVHFAFEDRIPKDVWDKNWTLWYDHAVTTRRPLPADLLLTGTFALEEVSTGMGADNMELVRPWAGIVARMQDLRRYYFLALEYPGKVALYRRDDHQWQEIAWAQVNFSIFTPYRLTLQCRGSGFKAWIDDQYLFEATDYGYADGGYCGARATCVAFVTDFSVRRLPAVPGITPPPAAALEALPAPRIVRDFDLAALGPLSKTPRHHAALTLGHFTSGSGEPQLLVQCFAHPAGATHALVDLHGRTLWTGTWPGANLIHVLPPDKQGRCDLIALGKELYRVDGRTGQVMARAPLPESPEGRIATGNSPQTQADLDGDGVLDTFFLTCGANNPHMWAYDHDLRPRWHVQTPSGHGHGWHLAVCDVDGDGRDEVFAGCTRLSPEGQIVWAQDEVVRRLKCLNGGHVDSSQAGFFDGPDAPPTVHYQASSAGHLVIDARSGALRAVHPQGHAQCGYAGRVIPGHAGVQVVSSNRWGSYGVTAIYDGLGNRLARFQPGFTCQYALPINWTGGEHEHLLVCDGQGYRGIYDHLGRRLVDLDALIPYARGAFEQRFDRVNTLNEPILGGPCDDLLIRIDTQIRILSADRPAVPGRRLYAPTRRGNASWPAAARGGH